MLLRRRVGLPPLLAAVLAITAAGVRRDGVEYGDVIGGGLSFPVPVDGLPPPPGAAAAAAAGRDRRDFGLSQDDFDYIMRSLGPGEEMAAAIQARAEEEESTTIASFPELTVAQRKFGVNPAFKSYFDPSFKREEGIDSPTNDEVVEPLLEAATDFRHPKKASYGGRSLGSHQSDQAQMDDIYFTTIVAVSSALAAFGIVGAGFCYHRVRRNSKASEDVDYPAYGVTGPGGKEISPTSGTDRKLAQNAQMYHYQHQKQQMIAFDSANGTDKRGVNGVGGIGSDCESDDGEEGDYTVYECPGLAPAGEMEVHNPLFQDDPTPKGK